MRISAVVLTLIAFVGLSVSANAALIVTSEDLVYDTEINMYFQRDWLAYTGSTYNEMRSSIEESTVGGFTDWRLASTDELFASSVWDFRDPNLPHAPSALAEIFQPYRNDITILSSGDTHSLRQWEGYTDLFEPSTFVGFDGVIADYDIETALIAGTTATDVLGGDSYSWSTFHMQLHRTNEQLNSMPLDDGAWVVSSGSSPVPEPATILLFGSGIVGLAVLRRRKPKN